MAVSRPNRLALVLLGLTPLLWWCAWCLVSPDGADRDRQITWAKETLHIQPVQLSSGWWWRYRFISMGYEVRRELEQEADREYAAAYGDSWSTCSPESFGPERPEVELVLPLARERRHYYLDTCAERRDAWERRQPRLRAHRDPG